MKKELDQLLVLLLAEEVDEGLRLERLSELDGGQTVLGEAEVKVLGDCSTESNQLGLKLSSDIRRTVLSVDGELLSDFGQV